MIAIHVSSIIIHINGIINCNPEYDCYSYNSLLCGIIIMSLFVVSLVYRTIIISLFIFIIRVIISMCSSIIIHISACSTTGIVEGDHAWGELSLCCFSC